MKRFWVYFKALGVEQKNLPCEAILAESAEEASEACQARHRWCDIVAIFCD